MAVAAAAGQRRRRRGEGGGSLGRSFQPTKTISPFFPFFVSSYVGYVPARDDLGIFCLVWRSEFLSKFLFFTEEKSTSGNRKDLKCVVCGLWSVVCRPCQLIPMCSTSHSRYIKRKTYPVHFFIHYYVNTVQYITGGS